MRLDARLIPRSHVADPGGRVPEVVIKVISAGSNTLEAIQAHFEDLQNGKQRALEIDFFSTPVVGKRAARALIDDWDLDLDELYYRQPLSGAAATQDAQARAQDSLLNAGGDTARDTPGVGPQLCTAAIHRPPSLRPCPPHRRAPSACSYGLEGDGRGRVVSPQYPQAHAARVAPGVRPTSLPAGDSGQSYPQSGAPEDDEVARDIQTG